MERNEREQSIIENIRARQERRRETARQKAEFDARLQRGEFVETLLRFPGPDYATAEDDVDALLAIVDAP